MMLTPEQLANLRQAAKGGWKVELDGRGIREIVAHIAAQQARIAELEQNRPPELTEPMIDAPRQFLLFYAGAHRAVRTAEMRRHLDLSGVDYSCWPQWALNGDNDITKAGAAILVWHMMVAAAGKPEVWPEDASDYGSRIAVVGQNGNDGLHYGEDKP